MNEYLGNPLQIRGAERYTLEGGRGDGMHFLCVRNGLGLEAWISLDRCADLSRVTYKGVNMGYFSPCGYVAPQYYDKDGAGFLKSFTAGFFTTAGLVAVGSPCTDDGEELPLHGNIANTPSELLGIKEDDKGITVNVKVNDSVIFGRKLTLERQYTFSYRGSTVGVTDCVKNDGDGDCPYMILYHCNMGYPLLDEQSRIYIPNNGVTPRNAHAAENIASAQILEKPQKNYEECCFYYDVKDEQNGSARVGIFSKTAGVGVTLCYNKTELPCFTEWKMMGNHDYVLGLEPGNCTPDGRDVLRKNGTLKFIKAGESARTGILFEFTDDEGMMPQ